MFTLEKWDVKYIDDVARFANNEKIAKNLRNVFPYPYTREDAQAYVEMCANDSEERQICRAIVIDEMAVGSIGVFLGTDVYEKSAELGYWLAEEYWNKGIMSEAVGQICNKCFEKFEINRIFAEPFSYNKGSRSVLEHNGFKLEGTMKNGVFKNGQYFDYCMYALVK